MYCATVHEVVTGRKVRRCACRGMEILIAVSANPLADVSTANSWDVVKCLSVMREHQAY